MTACVNKKSKRVAAVVTASLVGALSIGAPAVALAANVNMMAADSDAIANGSVAYKSGKPGDTFTYDGTQQGIVPSTLTPYNGEAVDVELFGSKPVAGEYYYLYVKIDDSTTNSDFKNVQYKNAKGKLVDLKGVYVKEGSAYSMPKDAGNYAVVVGQWNSTSWSFVKVADTFKIAGQTLDGAKLFEGDDVTDTSFAYDGTATGLTVDGWKSKLGVSIDGVKLDEAEDYDLDIYQKGGSSPIKGSTELLPGTTYIVKISGTNNFKDQVVEREFSFDKLDLSSAVIATNVATNQAPSVKSKLSWIVESINGVKTAKLDLAHAGMKDIAISFVSSPDGSSTSTGAKGAYTFTLSADANNKYVKGSINVEQVYADYKAAVDFNNDSIYSSDKGIFEVDLSDEDSEFDLSKIEVTYNGNTKLDEKDYDVEITDADGTAVEASSLKTPGTYFVKVSVNTEDESGKLVAGSAVAKVVVSYGVTNANVYVSYKGVNDDDLAIEDSYTGADLMKNVSIKVKAGDKELVEGTDYKLEISKKQTDGKWATVDSIVDAGDYKITVDGVTFTSDFVVTFHVKQAVATAVTVDQWVGEVEKGAFKPATVFLAYTGDEIKPTFTFTDKDGNVLDVPADAFTVSFKGAKGSKVLKDEDTYAISFDNAEGSNFDVERISNAAVIVKKAKSFADVNPLEWYAAPVYQAKQNGYVNGLRDTETFAPNATITRADVACVLFNMAGGTNRYEGQKNEMGGYETGFSDVDSHEYYALAIQWAKQAGVVNGYGDGTFNPLKQITREEFASMLANYAKALGDDVTVDDVDEVLDAYADANTVSDWAESNVAWAVENGVMGNGGFIKGNGAISRAEVASMAVNYQALPLK